MKVLSQQHVASIRNSRYKSWILKTIYKTHKESPRATFVEDHCSDLWPLGNREDDASKTWGRAGDKLFLSTVSDYCEIGGALVAWTSVTPVSDVTPVLLILPIPLLCTASKGIMWLTMTCLRSWNVDDPSSLLLQKVGDEAVLEGMGLRVNIIRISPTR